VSDPQQLLFDHQPYLRYDSHEAYFADSAAEMTDSPGDTLKQAGGTVLATAGAGLSLALLGPQHYADAPHTPAAATDLLSIADKDYRSRAQALHAHPEYANVVYGHVATDREGAVWLQYWCFYFFNDYNLIGHLVKAGLHEGDWEMVQVRLGPGGQPDHAVYAQHAHASGRPWDQVECVPGTSRPVVYVARGSHASYFEPGTHWTGTWLDYADGKRQSPDRQRLETIADGDPRYHWVSWPGRWGDTPKHGGIAPADSPRSPGVRGHWRDPLKLLDVAAATAGQALPTRPLPPPAPDVTVTRTADGAGVEIAYTLAPAPDGEVPASLTITRNSKDEPDPPATTNEPVTALTGTVTLAGLDPSKRYDLYISSATAKGLASESVRADVPGLA
jgi:Vacuolar protein sorting-associated protein 62